MIIENAERHLSSGAEGNAPEVLALETHNT